MKMSVLRENDEIDYVIAYFNLTQLHCTDWLAGNCTEETMYDLHSSADGGI
jgi:hypothetical protein